MGQVIEARRLVARSNPDCVHGAPISNVVFMGMGAPLHIVANT